MYRFLARPIWIGFALIVAVATFTFVSLGLWQLDRLEERRFENAIKVQRGEQEPVPIAVAVDANGSIEQAGDEHAFRTVTVTGSFDPEHEVLARSQTYEGTAGFHVVTPFVDESGTALLVNQGWIPLEFDEPPFTSSTTDTESIVVTLAASQVRAGFGPIEPDGPLERIARVDIGRLASQMPYPLYPVYAIAYGGPDPSVLPIAIESPEISEGAHLSYAIQWFSFATVSVVGFWALATTKARKRRALRQRSRLGA